jgi:CRP/FNR family cyclic AMP-dependent transcriptional regulator
MWKIPEYRMHVGSYNRSMRQSVETRNRANEHAVGLDSAAFEKILAVLPLATYRAGETVLSAGLKTSRLLILKRGAVVILKDSIEIGRVEEPGAVFGELSALLDQPHTADVRALKDSQFHVADAALLGKDPIMMFHVARILARRLVAVNRGLVELKKQLQAGQSPSALRKMFENIEQILNVSGSTFEQWI